MLPKTFAIIRGNLPAFLGFLAFDMLIDLSSRLLTPHLLLITFISTTLLSYFVYRAVLFEERFKFTGFDLRHFGKFLWRSIRLSLLFGLILVISSLPVFIAFGARHVRDNPTASIAESLVVLLTLPTLFAWLGTCLPATVSGQGGSFAEASKRGKTTFLPLLVDLIVPTAIGPLSSFLQGAGFFARYLPAPLKFQAVLGAPLPLAAIMLGDGLQLLVTVLYAVAISRAYLQTERQRSLAEPAE